MSSSHVTELTLEVAGMEGASSSWPPPSWPGSQGILGLERTTRCGFLLCRCSPSTGSGVVAR